MQNVYKQSWGCSRQETFMSRYRGPSGDDIEAEFYENLTTSQLVCGIALTGLRAVATGVTWTTVAASRDILT